MGRQRHDDAERDHPVAEDPPAERHGEAARAEPRVAEGLCVGDAGELLRHLGVGRKGRGEQDGVERGAQQVGEEHPAPVPEERAGARSSLPHGQGNEREVARHELEAEEHDHDEADRKDQGADEADARLQGRGEGERRRKSQEGSRQKPAHEQVVHGQPTLLRTDLDHLLHDSVGLHIGHGFAPFIVRRS